MKPRRLISLAESCAAGLAVSTLCHAASAEQQEQCPNTKVLANPPIYFTYPPGLIPPDLCSEVKRVQREVQITSRRRLLNGVRCHLQLQEVSHQYCRERATRRWYYLENS